MAPTTQSSLMTMPHEIRSMIFEHVFHAQRLRLKRSKTRGPANLGNLSILTTAKFFYKDPVVHDALRHNAIIVLYNEADWLNIIRLCFRNGAFDHSRLIKRMVWKVPEQLVHAKTSFFQEVTRDSVVKILLSLNTFEVQLNHNQHLPSHQTLKRNYQDASWIDRLGQNIAYCTLNSPSNRRNAHYEVIWSALDEVLKGGSCLNVTFRVPVLFDSKDVLHRPSGWLKTLILHDAIINLNDFKMTIETETQTYELQQRPFSLARSPCKSCGQYHCQNEWGWAQMIRHNAGTPFSD